MTASRPLSPALQAVLAHIVRHGPIARDTNARFDADATLGQRVADRVAAFGGSWTFILLFLGLLVAWTGGNWLADRAAPDPYPFIFLNLLLSMLAALQAPVIMMSQNRQAAKDRLDAAHDYEVNLKAEIEIMALHEKLDRMRDEDLKAMLLRQQEQIDLLARLIGKNIS
ncbi:DUF1003 domain-containing protein [Frigidibacter sp. MR17.14]|uniref:DUF1003 domain-containing protein n=1 Tax=Frigidibacter sp. MR17.14 TaxID=3126509 RepID=UPI0030131196